MFMATSTRWQDGHLSSDCIIGSLNVHEYLEVIAPDDVYNN